MKRLEKYFTITENQLCSISQMMCAFFMDSDIDENLVYIANRSLALRKIVLRGYGECDETEMPAQSEHLLPAGGNRDEAREFGYWCGFSPKRIKSLTFGSSSSSCIITIEKFERGFEGTVSQDVDEPPSTYFDKLNLVGVTWIEYETEYEVAQ